MCKHAGLCPFCGRSSSRHGYPGSFGGTFVYVHDCVDGRFSVISATRDKSDVWRDQTYLMLKQNYGVR